MTRIENICENISQKICTVNVLKDGELFEGSGVLIYDKDREERETGAYYIITAEHVLGDMIKNIHEKGENERKNYKIKVGFKGSNWIDLTTSDIFVANNLDIESKNGIGCYLSVDMAVILIKKEAVDKFKEIKYAIPVKNASNILIGKEIYLAGFPSDVVSSELYEVKDKDQKKYLREELNESNPKFLAIKPNYVVSTKLFPIDSSYDDNLAIFYADTIMFHGASGGGVFDSKGKCIGILVFVIEGEKKRKLKYSINNNAENNTGNTQNNASGYDPLVNVPYLTGITRCFGLGFLNYSFADERYFTKVPNPYK